MARATTPTLLSLNEWATIMGINLWEFNQIGEGFPVANQAQCQYVWYQYQWQKDFLSREEVAQAIYDAEHQIAQHLGYFPAPKWITDEEHIYPRPYDRELYGGGGTWRGQYKAVRLNYGYVRGAGTLARTSIGSANMTLSDTDGDGVDDKFTCSIATTVTDSSQIAIYFASADRNGDAIDETWRIRPVIVSISGGTATITGHSSLLVKPDLTTVTDPEILNVTSAAIYVTSVEVYRVYRDETYTNESPQQGTAYWELFCDDPPCTSEYRGVCLTPRVPDQAMVAVNYMANGCPEWREPDRLKINYLAGYALQANGLMDRELALMVARLATSFLPVGKCGCDRSNRIIDYWRVTQNDALGDTPAPTPLALDNPFNPSRGAVYAWQKIKQLKNHYIINL